MNTALPEMLHCLNAPGNLASSVTDVAALERQRARMRFHQEQLQQQLQQQQRYLGETDLGAAFTGPMFQEFAGGEVGFGGFVNRPVKVDPGLDNGWPDFAPFAVGEVSCGFGLGMNFEISRTASCPPAKVAPPTAAVAVAVAVGETKQRMAVLPEKTSSGCGRESSKKRKAEKHQNLKAIAGEDSKQKKTKESPEEGESKITEQTSNTTAGAGKTEVSGETSKKNSKETEVKKPDYIHVRARRGQATDSHSLAERVRREKISERMKFLQDLVPGCNKITGKAGMLDEIINYVQSLQRQVEFLSMKLAAVDPTLDLNIDNFLAKEVFPVCTSSFPIGVSSELPNPAFLQFNPVQQAPPCNGLDQMGMEAPDLALRRTTSAPVSMPETFLDLPCFNYIQASSGWDANLQSLYGINPFPSLQFTGSNEVSNMKMEI